MKSVGTLSKWILCGIVLAGLTAVSSVHAAIGKATVRAVRGTASYSEQAGDWKPLNVGRVLTPGATVKTGVSSQVDLFLEQNGPTVRVLENTTLALDKLNIDKTGADTVIETQLNLTQGTIQGYVTKLATASTYEVKTPNAVAGIRGTHYQISADDKVAITEGSVMVAYTNPSTKRISTHQVNGGQIFIPPVNPATDSPTVRGIQPTDNILPPPPPTTLPPTTQEVITETFVSPIAGEEAPAAPQQPPNNGD